MENAATCFSLIYMAILTEACIPRIMAKWCEWNGSQHAIKITTSSMQVVLTRAIFLFALSDEEVSLLRSERLPLDLRPSAFTIVDLTLVRRNCRTMLT